MKFIQFLTEKINLDSFKHECSEILKFYKEDKYIYRGTNLKISTIEKLYPRTDRNPRDTSKELHEIMDLSFKNVFGWKVRSEGIFTYLTKRYSQVFGKNIYLVFPSNGFKYVNVGRNKDPYIYILRDELENDIYKTKEEKIEIMTDFIKENYTNQNLFTNFDFISNRDNEVIFKCNFYYLCDIDYFLKEIKETL